MARPTTRTPRTRPEPTPDELTPAPDSGVPFSSSAGDDAPAPRRGKASTASSAKHQLGVRIPEDLWQELLAISEDTGISITRFVTRAIEEKVTRVKQAA